jgi:hypothetical protein
MTTPAHPDADGTPRLRPEVALALRRGVGDPLALLGAWFLRKSFYWMLAVGVGVGAILTGSNDVSIRVDSPGEAWSDLFSPLAGVIVAVLVRLGSSVAGLALAYPLAREYHAALEPRTGFATGPSRILDRLMVARAFRSLRWTHHVRQLALGRLGRAGRWLARVDPILDVINVAAWVVAIVAISVFGAEQS